MEEYSSPEQTYEVEESAAKSQAIMGVVAMGLAMTGFCSCYLGFIVAAILGFIAQMQGRRFLMSEPEGATRAYANVAVWTGLASLIFSVIILILIAIYIMLYIAFIGFLTTL